MYVIPEKNLFWFIKNDVKLDTSKQHVFDMYVQQVLTNGRIFDIKKLLKMFNYKKIEDSISRISRFLPQDVRLFWEDFFCKY